MGLLEIAIALVVEGRYSDFTLVNETVNAARNEPPNRTLCRAHLMP